VTIGSGLHTRHGRGATITVACEKEMLAMTEVFILFCPYQARIAVNGQRIESKNRQTPLETHLSPHSPSSDYTMNSFSTDDLPTRFASVDPDGHESSTPAIDLFVEN